MKKAVKIVGIFLLALLIWYLGHRQDVLQFGEKLPMSEFDFNAATIKPEGSTSLYQGLEVTVVAVKWHNSWFMPGSIVSNNGTLNMSEIVNNDIRATFFHDQNTLDFDPDWPTRGKPNLKVNVGNVQFYRPLANIHSILSGRSPVESYVWDTGNKLFKMDIWLLEFDLLVQIEPSHTSQAVPGSAAGKVHPITGERLGHLGRENNSKFEDVTLILKISPQQNAWLVANIDESGLVSANQNPEFGVFAVELIQKKWDGDPRQHMDVGMGSNTVEGQSFRIYSDLTSINERLNAALGLGVERATPIPLHPPKEAARTLVNKSIFGKPVFFQINYPQIGSWRDTSFLGFGETIQYSDREKLKFVIHTPVIGDWELKRPELTWGLKEGKRKIVRIPSILERILPSFGMGKVGKSIFAIFLLISALFILGIVSAPFRGLLETIKKLFKKG